MTARLFFALTILAGTFAAFIPGVPVMIDVPLNRTAFPTGITDNTTRAAEYTDVPVNQYAFFVPLNALSITINLTLPSGPNSYIDYDISTNGPICQFRYQLHADGYVCGGSSSENYYGTGTSRSLVISPVDGPSGSLWKVGTPLYLGFTADSSFTGNTSIQYTITDISIATCGAGLIGGENDNGDAACLPLVQVPASNSANFTYPAGDDAIFFQVNNTALVGLLTVVITVPTASLGSDTLSGYLYSAPLGTPSLSSSSYYECGSSADITEVGANTIATWTCNSPSAVDRYYISFAPGSTAGFNGTIAVTTKPCAALTGGANCSERVIDFGNAPAANMIVNTNFTTMAEESIQFRVNIPAMTAYPMNITFSANGSASVFYKANGYAGAAFGNSDARLSVDSTDPVTFVLQTQGNYIGQVAYFWVSPYYSGEMLNWNVTVSTSAAVTPTSSSTGTGSSATGTGSSGTASGSNSSSGSGSSKSSSGTSSTRSSSTTASNSRSGTSALPSDASMIVATGVVAAVAALLL